MIELMVVVAIIAILAALAMPSFTSLLARKRVEGVVSELATDLQYARSEAVQRNAAVTVTFGPSCYVIHTVATTVSCTQTSKTVTPAAAELKTVQLTSGTNASLTAEGSLASLTFDAVRGWPTFVGPGAGTTTVSLLGASSVVSDQLRIRLTNVGRVSTCAASGFASGYVTC